MSAPAIADHAAALAAVLPIATEAAATVLRVYRTPFAVDYKGVDDPVTQADREANELIVSRLAAAFPGVPVVAEESDPASYAGFEHAPAAWFVDPLDGTREFVARNGEFGVMIGLAQNGRARLGVLVAPALGRVFAGVVGMGAFELAGGVRRAIHVSSVTELGQARVTVSRSRRSPELDVVLDRMAPLEVTPFGSGVKGALVAAGAADVYLQVGRAGKRWDVCAPEAILVSAGGVMTDAEGKPLDYASRDLENTSGIVGTNGSLHDAVLRTLAGG